MIFKEAKKIIEKNWILFFVGSVILLSLITFWQVLSFGLWRDDLGFLWAAQYHPNLNLAWNLHPGTKYEDVLLFHIFGYNAFLWQSFGIFLRILAALSVALMMWGFFKSKWISILSGLFFAVSFGGLETVSWRSVHIVPLVIMLVSTGIYFFLQYSSSRRAIHFFLALFIFDLAVIVDPGRSVPVILLLILLQFINWILGSAKSKKIFLLDISVLLIICISLLLLLSSSHVSADPRMQTSLLMQDPTKIGNYFASLGNLIFGWLVNIFESGGLANYTHKSAYFACFLLILGLFGSTITFFIKRSKTAGVVLFFLIWILVFYLPNWIFDKNLVVAGTHRYVGVSAVGVVAILAILLSKIKYKKVVMILVAIFIFLNISTSHRILHSDSSYRLKTISEQIWNKIEADVPKNEKNSIFMYLGSGDLRANILDLSGGMPFAIKRKIANGYDVPISTTEYNLIIKLLCEENVMRPTVVSWEMQKTIIPLSRVHAWEMNNAEIKNVSERERKTLQKMAEEKNCEVIP